MALKNVSVSDPMLDPVTGEYLVVGPGHTFKSITEKISRIVLTNHTPVGWFLGAAGSGRHHDVTADGSGLAVSARRRYLGPGHPGRLGASRSSTSSGGSGIGHAGTLISAILLLFKQQWRNSINRFAEAMTIFAVVCAGIFPLIHVGRAVAAYWFVPISKFNGRVAAVPFAAAVGRLRGIDVRDDLGRVLVHWYDPRSRHHARPGAE